MLQRKQLRRKADIKANGFQGFKPLNKTQVQTLLDAGLSQEDIDTAQRATFVKVSTVEKVDDDAGNGVPLKYDAITKEEETIICFGKDVEDMANRFVNADGNLKIDEDDEGDAEPATIEIIKVGGLWLVETISDIESSRVPRYGAED